MVQDFLKNAKQSLVHEFDLGHGLDDVLSLSNNLFTQFKNQFPDEPEKLYKRMEKRTISDCLRNRVTNLLKLDKEFYFQYPITDEKIEKLLNEVEKRESIIQLADLTMQEIAEKLKAQDKQLPNYKYRGVMVDKSLLESLPVDLSKYNIFSFNPTENLHVTTSIVNNKTVVNDISHEDIGSKVTISVLGYAYHPEKGLALEVDIKECDNKKVEDEFNLMKSTRTPHITIGVAPGVKPKEMADLFHDDKATHIRFNKPVEFVCYYGGLTKDNVVDIFNNKEKSFLESTNLDFYNKKIKSILEKRRNWYEASINEIYAGSMIGIQDHLNLPHYRECLKICNQVLTFLNNHSSINIKEVEDNIGINIEQQIQKSYYFDLLSDFIKHANISPEFNNLSDKEKLKILLDSRDKLTERSLSVCDNDITKFNDIKKQLYTFFKRFSPEHEGSNYLYWISRAEDAPNKELKDSYYQEANKSNLFLNAKKDINNIFEEYNLDIIKIAFEDFKLKFNSNYHNEINYISEFINELETLECLLNKMNEPEFDNLTRKEKLEILYEAKSSFENEQNLEQDDVEDHDLEE